MVLPAPGGWRSSGRPLFPHLLDAVWTRTHTKASARKEKSDISPLLAVYQVRVQGSRAALIAWVRPTGWAIAHPISLL